MRTPHERRVPTRAAHQVEDADHRAGEELYLYQRVRVLTADIDRVYARVQDAERDYHVQMDWGSEEDVLRLSCECPAPRQERLCRHLWALLLQFDKVGGVIPGDEALAMAFPDEPLPEEERHATLSSGIRHWHRASLAQAEEAEAEEEEERPKWRDELSQVRERIPQRPRECRVLYDLDDWTCIHGQRLFIELYQRSIRTSSTTTDTASRRIRRRRRSPTAPSAGSSCVTPKPSKRPSASSPSSTCGR